jgi:hypothetical protein
MPATSWGARSVVQAGAGRPAPPSGETCHLCSAIVSHHYLVAAEHLQYVCAERSAEIACAVLRRVRSRLIQQARRAAGSAHTLHPRWPTVNTGQEFGGGGRRGQAVRMRAAGATCDAAYGARPALVRDSEASAMTKLCIAGESQRGTSPRPGMWAALFCSAAPWSACTVSWEPARRHSRGDRSLRESIKWTHCSNHDIEAGPPPIHRCAQGTGCCNRACIRLHLKLWPGSVDVQDPTVYPHPRLRVLLG